MLLPALLTGCAMDSLSPPAAQTQRKPPAPRKHREPPQIVEEKEVAATPVEEQDGLHQAIQGYIERVDGAHERARRRLTDENRPSDDTPRHVADAAVEQPPVVASQPPIVVVPESAGHTEPGPEVEEPPAPAIAKPAAAAAPEPEAPRVGSIHVRGVRGCEIETPPQTTAGQTGVNAAVTAHNTPTSLRAFLDQMVPEEDENFRSQLDRRLLWVVAGDYVQARTPLSLVTDEQQALAARFVEALIAIREAHLGDLATGATTAADELARLQESLRTLGDLSIPALEVCSAVRGFGQYDVIRPRRFLAGAGSEFVLYCEVRDFASEKRDDGLFYTVFDMTTTVLNRAGDTVLEIQDAEITDACRNRRSDCFIPRLIRLPESLSPGQYVAKVSVADKLGRKVAEQRVTFDLVARP
jgi:hypothetical protein